MQKETFDDLSSHADGKYPYFIRHFQSGGRAVECIGSKIYVNQYVKTDSKKSKHERSVSVGRTKSTVAAEQKF